MVPTFTAVRSTGEAPGFTPAASPRLRRRPSPWPPDPGFEDPAESSPPSSRMGTHREPAQIHRVRAGGRSRGVTQPVPYVYLPVSLTTPGPSGSPEPTRLCRGCSHPPRRPPDQAASSFTSPLRRQRDGRSLTSIRQQQRLVAHSKAAHRAAKRRLACSPRSRAAGVARCWRRRRSTPGRR